MGAGLHDRPVRSATADFELGWITSWQRSPSPQVCCHMSVKLASVKYCTGGPSRPPLTLQKSVKFAGLHRPYCLAKVNEVCWPLLFFTGFPPFTGGRRLLASTIFHPLNVSFVPDIPWTLASAHSISGNHNHWPLYMLKSLGHWPSATFVELYPIEYQTRIHWQYERFAL